MLLELVNLEKLFRLTEGSPDVRVGIIDGPVAFLDSNVAIARHASTMCVVSSSSACKHGTFVANQLIAERSAVVPGIAPKCTYELIPLFQESTDLEVNATPDMLAEAIFQCSRNGANVINISSGIISSSAPNKNLLAALNEAQRKMIVIISAIGNQRGYARSELTNHPWVIPVSACDISGRPTQFSNFSLASARQGVLAPGVDIEGYSSNTKVIKLTGTSFAVPFVTGAVALLKSLFPDATGAELRAALLSKKRSTIIPPILDAYSAYKELERSLKRKSQFFNDLTRSIEVEKGPAEMNLESSENYVVGNATSNRIVSLQDGGPDCKCKGSSSETSHHEQPTQFIYALGSLNPRFPNESVEKEYAQVLKRTDNAGLSDKGALKKLVSTPEFRYLLKQLCWVMSIQGIDTYVVHPSDPFAYDLLVDAVRPVGSAEDIDLVVGILGPLSRPEFCGGLSLPIVVFDQLYSFETKELVKSIPKPASIKDDAFSAIAETLFKRIMQLADNAGATPEHRALNYLAVRYPEIYSVSMEFFNNDYTLVSVETGQSRLSGNQHIIAVIFTFASRKTGVQEQKFVRVNVSGEFPFIVTPLQDFYSR